MQIISYMNIGYCAKGRHSGTSYDKERANDYRLFRGRSAIWTILALSSSLFLVGCATKPKAPDLSAVYGQSAQYHDPWRNPVMVIPGILGSKLVEEDTGVVAWGAFGGGAANPQKPDGARTISLPMEEGKSLFELRDNVVSDGALDRIRIKLFGMPIQLDAYFNILIALGAGGYRDESLGRLGLINYGDDHFTCFQFDYDWRRDNVESAQLLYRYMKSRKAYVREQIQKRFGVDNPDVKFDVVAHSMGGLVLRYMIMYGDADLPADGSSPELTWAGAELVERAIFVGPPNAGSPITFGHLVEGLKFAPLLPPYDQALIGTFPSLYQLLPRTRHRAIIDATTLEPIDIFDSALWEERGWGLLDESQASVLEDLLLEVPDAVTRHRIARDHLDKSLARGRQFQIALDRVAKTPEGLELHLVSGDAIETEAVVAVDLENHSVKVVATAPGDGTVLRSSALMDERLGGEWSPELTSPIQWTNVTFIYKDHLGITQDPAFTDNLLYLLLEAPR